MKSVGILRDTIEPTKIYSLEIWPARDGSNTAAGRMLTTPDGHSFDVHDRFGEMLPASDGGK